MEEVRELLSDLNVKTIVQDERNQGEPLNLAFHGVLWPEEQEAAIAMSNHNVGVLAATTAFGKTVVAAWPIAQRGVNTLVLRIRTTVCFIEF
jgi:superfamily II DNA or RNA helicase